MPSFSMVSNVTSVFLYSRHLCQGRRQSCSYHTKCTSLFVNIFSMCDVCNTANYYASSR